MKNILFSIKSLLNKSSAATQEESQEALYLLKQLTESDAYESCFSKKIEYINSLATSTIIQSRELASNNLLAYASDIEYPH